MDLTDVQARFRYEDSFAASPNVGYETLLYDCLIGDETLFQRADNIEAAWKAVDPVLQAWAQDGAGPEPYAAGTTGPKRPMNCSSATGGHGTRLTGHKRQKFLVKIFSKIFTRISLF